MRQHGMTPPKPVVWVGSAKGDLMALPPAVRRRFGYALFVLQQGGSYPFSKQLRGLHGVLEVWTDLGGNTYRLVATTSVADTVHVLHVFERSHRGISTPAKDIAVIRSRLRRIGGRP